MIFNTGLYIHIPYCKNKCLYCDFYSAGNRIADWDAYIKCVSNEMIRRSEELEFYPDTIYIGGGTPSLIPSDKFLNLMKAVKDFINPDKVKEFTLEVNPEDVSPEKIKIWKESGVNRVSLGVQSLQDNELRSIGRKHDSAMALDSLETLQKNFENISVDLMFGLPYQTIGSYKNSILQLISRNPSHISSYSLMLEEGTAMTHLVRKNKITLPNEESWGEMINITGSLLKEAGYDHYEISNFALPGKESRHNLSYWNGSPYLGVGPGAHSYDGNKTRRFNPSDLKGYLKHFLNQSYKDTHFFDEEILTDEELREEMIMTRLRTSEGLNLDDFETRFGSEPTETIKRKADRFIKTGYLKNECNNLILTESGISVSDTILSSLF